MEDFEIERIGDRHIVEILQQIDNLGIPGLEKQTEGTEGQKIVSRPHTGVAQELVSTNKKVKKRETLDTNRLGSLGGTQNPKDTEELVDYIHTLACMLSKKDKRQDPLSNLSMHNNSSEEAAEEPAMPEKSLDRIAELFSPKKGADNVTAALLKTSDTKTVYIARNGTFDDKDRDFAGEFRDWLRLPTTDETGGMFWGSLLRYNAERITGYLKSIQTVAQKCQFEGKTSGEELHGWLVVPRITYQLPLSPDFLKWNDKSFEWDMERLLGDFGQCFAKLPEDIRGTEYRDFVTRLVVACYYLRHPQLMAKLERAMGENGTTLCNNIRFLGRFVSAFETLSLQCGRYPSIRLELLEQSAAYTPRPPQLSNVRDTLARVETPEELIPSDPKKKLPYIKARQHAEIQLLGYFEREMSESSSNEFLGYIGISKNTCFLCCEVLKEYRRGFFRTRGSHGTIWPGWTISKAQGYSSDFNDALRRAFNTLARRFPEGTSNHKGDRESSPGVTVTTQTKKILTSSESEGNPQTLFDSGDFYYGAPLPWSGSDLAPWTFQINAWTPDEAILYNVPGGGGPGYLRDVSQLSWYQESLVESADASPRTDGSSATL